MLVIRVTSNMGKQIFSLKLDKAYSLSKDTTVGESGDTTREKSVKSSPSYLIPNASWEKFS